MTSHNKIERKFVNESLISKHIKCTICCEVFDDPKRIDCAHTFCHNCITQWKTKNSNCPICRQTFSIKELSRDLIAFNVINDLIVFCINKSKLI